MRTFRKIHLTFGLIFLSLLVFVLSGCQGEQYLRPDVPRMPGGSSERGRQALIDYGCGSCHQIPGITDANGLVGPPLSDWAERNYIAGSLANTPDNLILWLMNPQAVEPGTVMPNLAVTDQNARDIGAYLYTLYREQ